MFTNNKKNSTQSHVDKCDDKEHHSRARDQQEQEKKLANSKLASQMQDIFITAANRQQIIKIKKYIYIMNY